MVNPSLTTWVVAWTFSARLFVARAVLISSMNLMTTAPANNTCKGGFSNLKLQASRSYPSQIRRLLIACQHRKKWLDITFISGLCTTKKWLAWNRTMTRENVRLPLFGGQIVMIATVSINALNGWKRLRKTRLW